MLEYFTFKKVKKHRAEKAEKERLEKEENEADKATGAAADTQASPPPVSSAAPVIISKPEETLNDIPAPVLKEEDERFLEQLTSSPGGGTPNYDDETPPPLPPRIKTPVIEWDSDSSSLGSKQEPVAGKGKDKNKGKGKEKEAAAAADHADHKAAKRFSFVTNIGRNISLRKKPGHGHDSREEASPSSLKPAAVVVPEDEASREAAEIAGILDDLNLAVTAAGGSGGKKPFNLSRETSDLVGRFTQVLRDLVNGVPTAYGDLTQLIEDRDGVIERAYNKLPKGLRKLVMQLPDQLTSKLAPELLAVAAEAQGLSAEEANKDGGLKGAAKRFLTPSSLQELVTKPGAIASLLKGIVNALKLRWPAFIGTSALWSVAVFLLLAVLWYCYKRGREVRLEREASEQAAASAEFVDGSSRVEELPDDPQLPSTSSRGGGETDPTTRLERTEENEHVKVFPPAG